MKLAYIQSEPLLNRPAENIEHLRGVFGQVRQADIVVLPELANSGYNFRGKAEAIESAEKIDQGEFSRFLSSMAQAQQQTVISGINERAGDHLYNSAVIYNSRGEFTGHYRKLHLFLNEKDIFTPGDLGLPVFESDGVSIGLQVCFDWAFSEGWRILALRGAQVIAHPSNLVLAYAQKAIPAFALINKTFIITANRTGCDRNLRFTGGSIIADPEGNILSRAGESHTQTGWVDVNIDKAEQKQVTAKNNIFEDRRTDVYDLR